MDYDWRCGFEALFVFLRHKSRPGTWQCFIILGFVSHSPSSTMTVFVARYKWNSTQPITSRVPLYLRNSLPSHTFSNQPQRAGYFPSNLSCKDPVAHGT